MPLREAAEQLALWYEHGRAPLSVTADDLARVWGAGRIHRFAAREVEPLDLPALAKSTLVELGLPARISWIAFVADTGEDGRTLGPIELPGRLGQWCRFAWAYNLVWCIESHSGEVWLMSPDWTQRDQFVNSSLRTFLEFVFRYEIFRQVADQDHTERSTEELDRLTGVLSRIDPQSFNPGTAWTSFFEEIRLWLTPIR